MNEFAVGGVLFLVIAIVEIVLSWRWNERYFALGIPIFVRRVEKLGGLEDLSLEALQKSAATVAATPLLFRRVAPDRILFREKGFGGSIHYLPIMRGVITAPAAEGAVVMKGLLNWFALAIVALFLWWTGGDLDDMAEVAPYVLGAFGIVYLIQAVRYSRVARAIK